MFGANANRHIRFVHRIRCRTYAYAVISTLGALIASTEADEVFGAKVTGESGFAETQIAETGANTTSLNAGFVANFTSRSH